MLSNILYSNKEVTMAFRVYNFENNDDVKIVAQTGQFKVIQWNRDLSVSPDSAQTA